MSIKPQDGGIEHGVGVIEQQGVGNVQRDQAPSNVYNQQDSKVEMKVLSALLERLSERNMNKTSEEGWGPTENIELK